MGALGGGPGGRGFLKDRGGPLEGGGSQSVEKWSPMVEGPVQTADRAPGWGMRGPTEDKDLGGERKLENRGGP